MLGYLHSRAAGPRCTRSPADRERSMRPLSSFAALLFLIWPASAAGNDCDGDGFPDPIDPTPCGFDGADGREDPLSLQLHIHGSLSEGDATILSQDAQAAAYDVDVLYWSDHDTMIQMIGRPEGLDFDDGALTGLVEGLLGLSEHGFYESAATAPDVVSEVVASGEGGSDHHWHLEAEADPSDNWSRVTYEYRADHQGELLFLLSGARAQLSVRPLQAASADWRLKVSFLLSGNLDGTRNRITYYLGTEDLTAHDGPHALHIPLAAAENLWTSLEFPLPEDAAHFEEAEDQNVRETKITLEVRNGVRVGLDLDDWQRGWRWEGEALRRRQQRWIDDHYAGGDVTHFVGQEITGVRAARHVIPIGPDIPMIEYRGAPIDVERATSFVASHGGLAQCTHPFGVLTEVLYEGDEAAILRHAWRARWLDAAGFGCDALEVGYRERVLGLEDHLWLWDELGIARLFVTGTGTSDNHWVRDWALEANRFATWVFLDVPDEAGIRDALLEGRAFFGDPIPFVGQAPLLDLWSEHGAAMGQVLRTDLDQVLHVETGYLEPGWTLALVVNGEVVVEETLDGSETDTVFELERDGVRLVRAELRDLDGEPILVTNPIYLIPLAYPADVPPERLPPG